MDVSDEIYTVHIVNEFFHYLKAEKKEDMKKKKFFFSSVLFKI